MGLIFPTRKRVEEVARHSLREKFPLYDDNHLVIASNPVSKKESVLEYSGFPNGEFVASFNWRGKSCYLGHIELKDKSKRGNGFGWALYETVFDIAERLNCIYVTQIPTGFIVRDSKVESREEYLLRRGCKKGDNGFVDWIIKE